MNDSTHTRVTTYEATVEGNKVFNSLARTVFREIYPDMNGGTSNGIPRVNGQIQTLHTRIGI